jgi:hypothetical protein
MDIASRLHAASEAADADLGDIASKFARVARAVRQTIFLESRLGEEDRRRRAAQAPQTNALDPPWWIKLRIDRAEGQRQNADRKLEITRVVQRAIDRAPDPRERERLEDELSYRLEVDFQEDRQLSNAQLIAAICRDLGLSADWASFAEKDWRWAAPETREALIASPSELLADVAAPKAQPSPMVQATSPPIDTGSGYNPPDRPRAPP